MAVAAGLSGCGTNTSPPPAPSASAPVHDAHDQTDIAFAQNVILRLAQENDIAALADGRPGETSPHR